MGAIYGSADEVKKLQTALNNAGYNAGAVDGIYGNQTASAVNAYIKANGIQTGGSNTAATTAASSPSTAAKAATTPAKQAKTYTPSDNVSKAQAYLEQVQSRQPGAYQSQYSQALTDAYNNLMGQEKFEYNVNEDALYNQYKDLYMQHGKQAMQDTMGQAAQLTGGYGNSYASTAGNQAYQQYLTKLNEMVPELEQRAYDRYQDDYDRMKDQYSLAQDMEGQDYNRYQDTLSNWQTERSYAQSAYDNAADTDYNRYADQRDYNYKADAAERADARDLATSIIGTGQMPGTDLLNAAGISQSDAEMLARAYGYGSTSTAGTGSYSGGTSSGSTEATSTYGKAKTDSRSDTTYDDALKRIKSQPNSVKQIDLVQDMYESGQLTAAQVEAIDSKLKLGITKNTSTVREVKKKNK